MEELPEAGGRSGIDPCLTFAEGPGPATTLITGFQLPTRATICICYCQPPTLWWLITTASGNEYLPPVGGGPHAVNGHRESEKRLPCQRLHTDAHSTLLLALCLSVPLMEPSRKMDQGTLSWEPGDHLLSLSLQVSNSFTPSLWFSWGQKREERT